jgi:hypothetical protein
MGKETRRAGAQMLHIAWEFVVRSDRLSELDRYYSGVGPWAQSFGKSPGFRGSVLLLDPGNPRPFSHD